MNVDALKCLKKRFENLPDYALSEEYDKVIVQILDEKISQGWIKVSDRLPTKADAVGKLDEVLIYTDGKPNPIPWHCITFCPEGYDYWQPLPTEPPKET